MSNSHAVAFKYFFLFTSLFYAFNININLRVYSIARVFYHLYKIVITLDIEKLIITCSIIIFASYLNYI